MSSVFLQPSSAPLEAHPSLPSSFEMYKALICEERINALIDCDKRLLCTKYKQGSFLVIFRSRGRNFGMIAAPLCLLLIWDIVWAVGLPYIEDIRLEIASMGNELTPIFTAVSFLLVFRLGRSATRFWDARAASGKMVEMCRALASTAIVACDVDGGSSSKAKINKEKDILIYDFVRWIAVLPIAAKNFLRPGELDTKKCRNRRSEIGALLSDEEADRLVVKPHDCNNYVILFVVNKLRQLAFRICNGNDENNNKGMIYRQLNEQIDYLLGSVGAMERIDSTPLPFVYVVHLRTFLIAYLFFWNLQAIAKNGWISIPSLFLANWGLLGTEAAAVECERPFYWSGNHLAQGKTCAIVACNIAQTMKDLGVVM